MNIHSTSTTSAVDELAERTETKFDVASAVLARHHGNMELAARDLNSPPDF